MIKKQVLPNFANLETALRTYDRDALVCGGAAWRFAYHTIHSADKWFINPYVYDEPPFHEEGLDNPYLSCRTVLSDDELLSYLEQVKQKTLDYLDSLTDTMLYEKPEACPYTRLELVLGQFRHISVHTGMMNGLTIEQKGKFPVYVGMDPSGFDKLKQSFWC